ncbi:hypothetical [Yersinia pestis KIM10+]|uniref:Uncharacterized protein n=1 Tax=Yersinia pestis TaxID=632 RepID=Q8CKB1_YERPE|nr:hypothetical [Yersinia pestis KIM10+]
MEWFLCGYLCGGMFICFLLIAIPAGAIAAVKASDNLI